MIYSDSQIAFFSLSILFLDLLKCMRVFVCLFFFFFLNACSCTKDVLGAYGGQKRALDSQELEVMDVCELPYWCWELNQCSL